MREADDEVCGSEPPPLITDAQGDHWAPGDCWCTREPGHEGECACEICTERNGAPGWTVG